MHAKSFARVFAVRSVPGRIVAVTVLASVAGLVFSSLLGWPLWRVAAVMLLPWFPLLTRETVWTYRQYGWLALFYVLAVMQTGHFFEHVAQMIQIHFLGLSGSNARGVIGTLDVEWVHFIFNTWVAVAAPLLLWRFRENPWLWAATILSLWHEIEHVAIMIVFLSTGKVGTPGLLSQGGLISGGLPIVRADLHFLYNLAETVPIVIAFVHELAACDRHRGHELAGARATTVASGSM